MLAATGVAASFGSAEELPPESWPIRFSRVYRFEQGSVSQIVLDWEGLKARRFYLVLEAPRPFDVSVVRARDSSILYSDRRASRHTAIIPWGRNETAHLSLKTRDPLGIQLTMKIATDPAEGGLAIYSFYVNQYLRQHSAGEMTLAEASLAKAVEEDPADTMAAFLYRRLWQAQGLTVAPSIVSSEAEANRHFDRIAEGQQVARLILDIDRLMAANDADSARATLGTIDRFETSTGRSGWLRARGRIELAEGEVMRSIFSFHEALDTATLIADRLEVYRMLLIANRALGNDVQVEEIRSTALSEVTDEHVRERIRAW
jgi:hypothetical protein